MTDERYVKATGHIAVVAFAFGVIILLVSFVVDTSGTVMYALKSIANPKLAWAAGLTMYGLTTVYQVGAGAIVYKEGGNPYIAGIASLLSLIPGTDDLHIVAEFNDMRRRGGGMLWSILFFYPSIIFDVYTDSSFLLSIGITSVFMVALSLSSMLFEQMVLMVSLHWENIKDSYGINKG